MHGELDLNTSSPGSELKEIQLKRVKKPKRRATPYFLALALLGAGAWAVVTCVPKEQLDAVVEKVTGRHPDAQKAPGVDKAQQLAVSQYAAQVRELEAEIGNKLVLALYSSDTISRKEAEGLWAIHNKTPMPRK